MNISKCDNTEKELRQKLINDFIESNSGKYNEIVNTINSGDLRLAYRIVHSLKNNASLLGITALQCAARDIEEHLKSGESLIAGENLTTLENELNKTLAELTPQVNKKSRSEPELLKPPDADELRKLRVKLAVLLEEKNMESMRLIDILWQIPGTDELIHQIEDLEFKQALITLNDLGW